MRAALLPRGVPVIVAMNKIDTLADKRALLPRLAEIAALREFAAHRSRFAPNEARELPALKRAIAEALPAGPALYPADELTDRDERFLAAEFIREKIFRQLGDEVPYGTAVAIEASSRRASCAASARRCSSTSRASARS